MYIQNLAISNLRCFKKEEITFCHPGRTYSTQQVAPRLSNITLLLGNNGSGKTTVLRAIAMAAIAPIIGRSGFRPYSLVRRTSRAKSVIKQAVIEGKFVIHSQDVGIKDQSYTRQAETTARIHRRGDYEDFDYQDKFDSPSETPNDIWENIYTDRSSSFLVVGYGASRRVELTRNIESSVASKSRSTRYQRVAGLFEDYVALTPLGAWLPEFKSANPGRHKQVINLINRLLPEGAKLTEKVEDGDYVFNIHGSHVPFAAVSDGYRAYIGWIVDLLYHICMGAPSGVKIVENRGIVLIDEIDLHLHPEWQRNVIPQLARHLPNLQFVLTSHSPIVVGTLESTNLRVMESTKTGISKISEPEESVFGLNADQILTSLYFGLHSSRAPEATNELHDLSVKAQHGDLDAARRFLHYLAKGQEENAS